MKRLHIQTLILTLLLSSSLLAEDIVSIPENKEDFHVFLLMGQSNMEGAQSIDGDMDETPHPRILKLNSWGSWEQAVDPITNNQSVAVGPGLAFAKKLVEENSDVTIGLIPLAVGGTEISLWLEGTEYYEFALDAAIIAKKYGVLKGVLWHQGEHDSFFYSLPYIYERRLIALIDDFRQDVQDPYLFWIVGGFSPDFEAQHRDVVMSSLKKVGTQFFRTGYVSSKDIPSVPDDGIHISSEGQRIMGERYANEYLRFNGFDSERPRLGHWTQQAKLQLDAEAIDNGDGWKFHPILGVYYDERYPIIKHAQLGWLELEMDAEMNIRIDSPYIGKDPTFFGRQDRSVGKYLIIGNDGEDEAMYIQSEDLSDPENPLYGIPFYIHQTRLPGDPYTYYDHSTYEYIPTIGNLPLFEDSRAFNTASESLFVKAQESDQLLRNLIEGVEGTYQETWSDMRRLVDDVQYFRDLTNMIAWEGYHSASENERGRVRSFWMDQFLHLLYTIDPYVVSSQEEYQDATNLLLYPVID